MKTTSLVTEREDRVTPIKGRTDGSHLGPWEERKKKNQEWKLIPHSFLLLVSPAIKRLTVYAGEGRQRRAVCTVKLSTSIYSRIYITHTKSARCPWIPSPQQLKMAPVVTTEPHRPLQAASWLGSPVWPSGWQLPWTTVPPQLRPMPKACVRSAQYHRLHGCSTHPLQRPERTDTLLLQPMITLFSRQMDTEIGTRLWTWVKAPLQSAAALYGREGESLGGGLGWRGGGGTC